MIKMARAPRFTLRALLALALVQGLAQGGEVSFPRQLALSPDGEHLAFSWRGDLWVAPGGGGLARRLTVHAARDGYPVWSPDGTQIAFGSERGGSWDLFLTTPEGERPRRLTWDDGTDVPSGWSPDGEAVLFTTSREHNLDWMRNIYQVGRGGGLPVPVTRALGADGILSGDGSRLVLRRGSVPSTRQRYRGSANCDLWLCELSTGAWRRLTEHPGNDDSAAWGGDAGTLYYRSDRSGAYEIWRLDLETGEQRQITRVAGSGVQEPAVSRDGSTLVYRVGGTLFRRRLPEGSPEPVHLRAPGDSREGETLRKTYTSDASEIEPSPDGKQLALVVRGEVYVRDAEREGRTNRITTNPAREQDIAWDPEGKTLLLVSDREGQEELYRVSPADPDRPRLCEALQVELEPLTRTSAPETHPVLDPPGHRLAFVRGAGDLLVQDQRTGVTRRLISGWSQPRFSFSPDGRWLLYTRSDNEFNTDVFLQPSDGSRPPLNISRHPDSERSAVWAPNGRFVAFLSSRSGDTSDLWLCFLRQADWELPADELEDLLEHRGRYEPTPEEKKRKGKDRPLPRVLVDPERIHERVRRLTSLPGDERSIAVSPDSKQYAFISSHAGSAAIYTISYKGGTPRRLGGTDPRGGLRWSADGKKIWYSSGGRPRYVTPSGGSGSLGFQARYTVSRFEERRQKFLEAWRHMGRTYYDPQLHGADWEQVRQRYETLAVQAETPDEFDAIFDLVLGELNSSHVGISTPGGSSSGPALGHLGVTWDLAHTGEGLRVAAVLPGGPAHRQESRLQPGEILLVIDEVPLTAGDNPAPLLVDRVSEPVRLQVRDAQGQERQVVLRPASRRQISSLVYEDMLRQRRELVETLSEGRLAYVHIRGMSTPSLERFEAELYSEAHGKDGLLIDVRSNGGGWTADYLLTILTVTPHAETVPRGGSRGYPQDRRPFYVWTRPAALLCNQFSFSNAEIFTHAFRTLGRGPIIGETTYGGVISTGSHRLLDGTRLREPFRGWFVKGTGEDMELHGAEPDHRVEMRPEAEIAGRDPQLERAVEVLLGELQEDE